MKKVTLLIANAERRLSNLIESVVLDACFEQTVVETTRISRSDELVKLASSGAYRLVVVVVAADSLPPGPGLGDSWVSAHEARRAIRAIRRQADTSVFAVAVSPEDEASLLEIGVECVGRLPFDNEKLKSGVRRALRMADSVEESKPGRWSWSELIFRGLHRPKNA
jgi:hypothetical protein